MTESNPIPAELEDRLKAFLPEWKKYCNEAQEALCRLQDLQIDALEIKDDELVIVLPDELSALMNEVFEFDFEDIEAKLLTVDPDLENLGTIGREIEESTLSERAMAKWHRSGGGRCSAHAAVYHKGGRRFVEIWDDVGVTLAVYRVSAYRDLRRLKEWEPTGGGVPQFSSPPVRTATPVAQHGAPRGR